MLAQVLAIATLLLPLPQVPPVGAAAPTAFEEHTLVAFNARIEAYMRVHQEVEDALGIEWSFNDAEGMFDAMDTLQSGIRAVRAHAAPGDVFTADVAGLIRGRLKKALTAHHVTVDEVLAFLSEERSRGARTPRVNQQFPWELGSAMPPLLIAVLPALPDELQYRFANRTLVLVDIHADLVVDLLPNALPPAVQDPAEHHP